ncbi:MAG: RpiB/LacA/LacB family sugar-phosphate isomerase, partial [Bacteroidota bacterium]|nr:RpiB/LacA/LacB family sugar-phosphate isomerase [Bacteroidota bacterium]
YDIKDFGTNSEESVDYPDIAHALSKSINDGIIKTGILICGSGIGVSIVANKYDNVRAALCWKKDIAMFSRMHNNANVLCLPARFIEDSDAIETLQVFMKTEFEGGRHERRVEKINKKL